MDLSHPALTSLFSRLHKDFAETLQAQADLATFPARTEILREGQFVQVVPVVVSGLVKVFTRHEDKELLLYYIQPMESCVMSFSAGLEGQPSRVFAVCEEDTTLLLLPARLLPEWARRFPDINQLFFRQFSLRYDDLLSTLSQVLFDRMDRRLMAYLQDQAKLKNQNPLRISHRQIANDLGTAREVITRVLKKLEADGKVRQAGTAIEILAR
ncbi:MAG: Crp/Fnr family transcriptional regulator [Cyclobacteriaceae bacterium]|nr:Crp/Fnr family transcriptional regulator [Cyclobacteriaceae bacterium]